jgi:tetratricopeptide (TPR) repeat protein
VFRLAIFFLLFAGTTAWAQESSSAPAAAPALPPAEAPATQPGEIPSSAPAEAAASPQPVSEEVVQAEAAIVKSDWKAAQDKLDPWLKDHPEDARALFDAGYVADAQDRLDDAVALYERAVGADPKSFEAHASLGLLLARQNKTDDARPELAAAAALDPGDAGPLAKAKVWRALAQIDRDDDATRASDDLIEALKLSPETEADTLLAASLADEAGEAEEAEKAYRRVLAEDPKSAAANAGLAHLLIARKEFAEAEPILRTALEQTPDDPALTAQLATVLAAQDKAEALPVLQKLHKDHPANADVTRMLAEVLAEAGETADSDELYRTLLTTTPEDAALLVAHGQNLIRLHKYPEAFAAFDKASQVDTANADAWSGLAFAASRVNQPSVTLHALTMRSKFLPEVPSTYFLWATSYDMLHKQEAAATYYHKFLESSAGTLPDQEFQARQRLRLLENKK